MRNIIISIITDNISRVGIDSLIDFLNDSDYFTAPASSNFHGSEHGGLARHSYAVYELLNEKNARYNLGYSQETIIIAGLFHDLCKTNFYVLKNSPPTAAQLKYLSSLAPNAPKNISKSYASKLIDHLANGGEHPGEPGAEWFIKDGLPMGHGEKSVYLLQKHINLTDDEALAIRWHMVAFDPGIHFDYPSGYPFRQAANSVPLLTALFTADYEASNLLKL